MYYTDYKKRNGAVRKEGRSRADYGEQQDDSFYRSGERYRGPNEGRYESRNTYSGYDVGRWYRDNEPYESQHRNPGTYYNETHRASYGHDRDEHNLFERAGDHIKQGWNAMVHDDDERYGSVHSRYNYRQAGYDNGDQRESPPRDEAYGYHHQPASYGYAGDNRSYDDTGYGQRQDGYNERHDHRNSYYTSADRDDDYYHGYSEFDRGNDRRREERWRGSFI